LCLASFARLGVSTVWPPMPKRVKSAAADATALGEAATAKDGNGEDAVLDRGRKRQKTSDMDLNKDVLEDRIEDEACMLEAIARHKDMINKAKTKPKHLGKDEEAEEAKRHELAARAKRNEALRQKGKMTKKEKYKAAKAALKAKTLEWEQGAASKGSVPCQGLEAQALADAGMETLDPRAVDCFLTGLPYMASERHVQDHFAKVGPCKVELLRDSVTGKSTGKGFATFLNAEQALHASTYSGTKIQNRWIHVRLCEVRDNGKRRTNTEPGEKPEGCLSAVVTCDKSVSEASLWKFFEDCGVIGVSRMMDKETGEFRGMAFLDFDDTTMVDKAVAKNGHSIKGKPCFVRYKSESGGSKIHTSTDGRVAAHNRAPPVPPPCGKATQFEESDSEVDEQ